MEKKRQLTEQMQISSLKLEQYGGSTRSTRRSTDAGSRRAKLLGNAKDQEGSEDQVPAMIAQSRLSGLGRTESASGPSFPISPIPAVNVASVPQRSPLRYPGGKTWLIPHIRSWLRPLMPRPRVLIEPFCGGGTVALTAVCEELVDRSVMAEFDHDVAAFWHAALRHNDELRNLISEYEPTLEAVSDLAGRAPRSLLEHGFRTLVLNRTRRGGILAPGAALTKSGENNKGLASRWYPDTIIGRLRNIQAHTSQITFCETDGMELLETFAELPGAVAFIDPPYTAGGKRAGNRLYAHHQLDHRRLFKVLAEAPVEFLMTYDCAPEIADLIEEHGFHAVEVVMRNTHHARISELVITRRAVFT